MSLVEFQRQMIRELLGVPAHWEGIPGSFHTHSRTGMNVHRHTILAGLVNAMRTTFATVVKLLGDDFFRRIATDYARAHPPASPVLFAYGDTFPAFLKLHPYTRDAALLADAARFDLVIDRTAHQPKRGERRTVSLAPSVDLVLDATLQCLQFSYPVDLVRETAEESFQGGAGFEDGLAIERYLAIWRSADGAGVKPLSRPAALFLEMLIAGNDATTAMDRSISCAGPEAALAAIQGELFSCSCVELRTRTC